VGQQLGDFVETCGGRRIRDGFGDSV
jgi:hypothetical protein